MLNRKNFFFKKIINNHQVLSYVGAAAGTKEKNNGEPWFLLSRVTDSKRERPAGLAVLAGAGSALWGLHSVLKTCELLPIFDNGRFHI